MPDSRRAGNSGRPEKKATLRLSQRELTRLSTTVVLILVLLMLYGGYRAFLNFKAGRDAVIARDNLHRLHGAFKAYAQDWDGRLPPAANWTEAIQGYLTAPPGTPGGPASYLQGPGDGETVRYVYNELAAGYNLEPTRPEEDRQKDLPPDQLVLLIEQPGAKPNATNKIPPQNSAQAEDELFKQLNFPHNAGDMEKATTVVLYASGRIKYIIRKDTMVGSKTP
jgi:hypothetical protein